MFHPNIKFTNEPSTESIPFLDLRVKHSQSKLETDLHIKTTDRHQYLHYSWTYQAINSLQPNFKSCLFIHLFICLFSLFNAGLQNS